MARPKKNGLDYFPLDVDIDQNDKISLIETDHGLEGFAIVIKLMMKIYKDGYYYEWTEREQKLFSRRVYVDINSLSTVVNDCINYGIFNRELFERHNILTSRGIQKRYFTAIGRRQSIDMVQEYCLLSENDLKEYKNISFVALKGVNVDINPTQEEFMSTLIPKEKKRKEKKSKEKEKESKEDDVDNNNFEDEEDLTTSSPILPYDLSIDLCKYYSSLKPAQTCMQYNQQLAELIQMYGYDETKAAMKTMASKTKIFALNYMVSILQNKEKEKIEGSDIVEQPIDYSEGTEGLFIIEA